MEQTQIARLFGLFAGDDTLGETYGAVLETAVLEVEQACFFSRRCVPMRTLRMPG